MGEKTGGTNLRSDDIANGETDVKHPGGRGLKKKSYQFQTFKCGVNRGMSQAPHLLGVPSSIRKTPSEDDGRDALENLEDEVDRE